MKIYFAGPLFTPYVRNFISEHAEILREHGIQPFVPHENFKPRVTPERVEGWVEGGLLTRQELEGRDPAEVVACRVREGTLTRSQLKLPSLSPEEIFEKDYEGLSAANAVVALLDGTQVDDGTACEIGIFHGLMLEDPTKKGVVGFMTDSRGSRKADHGYGINLFVLGVIEEGGVIYEDFDDVIAQLKKWDEELRAVS
jgi:nucleoside 2-deoxyribosyltransferase